MIDAARYLLSAGFLAASAAGALAQTAAPAAWAPGRAVRLLVPFPAGGTADVMARLVANHVQQTTGQQMVVENRPGGGTVIATELVARAPADGTTALLMANSFVINAGLRPNLPYNPLTSFEPVCFLAQSPHVLAVNNASPHKTFAEFQAAAKDKPGTLTLGALAPATAQHIAVEMLKRAAGIDITLVPFPGGAPAVTNLVGGHVNSAIANYSEVKENLGSSLRPLFVGNPRRLAFLAEVPTLTELGMGDVIATSWFGIVVPAKTPQPLIDAIAANSMAAMKAPDVLAKMEGAGIVADPVCGAPFAAMLKTQAERYAKVIKESGIKE